MKKARAAHVGTTAGRPRKHRPRPVPRWLTNSTQLEQIARSRCLLVLSVLSGEIPVTDAIERAKISRGTYYQLETRALRAILAAMNPLASSAADGAADLSAATQRIEQLEAQVHRLEQEKRRTHRLLLLMRKSIRAPVATRLRTRRSRGQRARSDGASATAQNLLSSPTSPGANSP
jgi:cell division protein FtsB